MAGPRFAGHVQTKPGEAWPPIPPAITGHLFIQQKSTAAPKKSLIEDLKTVAASKLWTSCHLEVKAAQSNGATGSENLKTL